MLNDFLINSIIMENNVLNKEKTINKLLANIEVAYDTLREKRPDSPSVKWRDDENLIPFSQGNHKLPPSTYIVNLGCSNLCPGRALGTCKQCDVCYAYKAERQYKEGTLLYRLLQTLRWRKLSAKDIANQLLTVSDNAKVNKMQYLRLNESGDVFDQNDIKKMSKIADILAKNDIGTYTYTSRYDMDWSEKSDNLIVNGSGFMVDNQFQVCKKHNDDMLYQCHGNCDTCNYCKDSQGIIIYVEEH